jgi:hypothetical protein
MRASSWRRLPAAALRGLANSFWPASRWRWFRLEVLLEHQDFAAHFQHRGDVAAVAVQAQRNHAHGADIGRDVLAGVAVAARGGLHEHAVLVAQAHRQAVEFQFGRVGDLGGGVSRPSRTRRSKLSMSSSEKPLFSDSIGTACVTCLNSGIGAAPTREVGVSFDTASGCAALQACSSRNSGRTRRPGSSARRARGSCRCGGSAPDQPRHARQLIPGRRLYVAHRCLS